ncbi:LacI family DNA-binding transcriptional regulator [Tessaracoccus terricola]
MTKRRPTLNDVVGATGLSIYTVSRALNGAEGVSKASREKVLEAARQIGYVPNTAARALRNQTPGPVLVMTASTANAYYIDMVLGIQAGLRSAGLGMRTVDLAPNGVFDAALEDAAVNDAMQSRAAGIVSALTLSASNYEKLTEWGIPVVFVDSHPPDSAHGAASVTTDNVSAASQVGAHLAQHGQDDWVLLIYPHLWSTRASREAGLKTAAERHGATLSVVECANDPASAKEATRRMLEERTSGKPFAFIAGDNPILLGALTAIREQELAVPRDICLLSFDEFEWAPLVDPPMTVVDEDSRAIGELAAKTLRQVIHRNSGPEAPAAGIRYIDEDVKEVAANLLVRKSCGCA